MGSVLTGGLSQDRAVGGTGPATFPWGQRGRGQQMLPGAGPVPGGGQESAGEAGPSRPKARLGAGQHVGHGVCCDSSSISTWEPSRVPKDAAQTP